MTDKDNKYYIGTWVSKGNHAGSKAVLDCEAILKQNGYNRVYIPFGDKSQGKIKKFKYLFKLFCLNRNSIVVVQHPIYVQTNYIELLYKLKKLKNIKLIYIIHDLECIRKYLPNSELYAKRDFRMFETASAIIAHNNKMVDYIEQTGLGNAKIIALNVFDYLIDDGMIETDINRKEGEYRITVAGNLDKKKSEYVYELIKEKRSYSVLLYGPNFERDECFRDCEYIGQYSPDTLPNKIKGEFGLVWDGNSIKTCNGAGSYLKYNNPHKLSLYIVSGIPVIIWSQSALYDYVIGNRLGIAVDSLQEIENKLSEMSEEEYQSMMENVSKEAIKLKNGYYLTTALNKAEQAIKQRNC